MRCLLFVLVVIAAIIGIEKLLRHSRQRLPAEIGNDVQ
jgi:hypothetical protein